MGYRVAVVGATGNVGREILNVLAERQLDRKSTRLNSSHVEISYAVFCLKKKKKKQKIVKLDNKHTKYITPINTSSFAAINHKCTPQLHLRSVSNTDTIH